MSPSARPPIPLQMAGGRPQPGNLMRRPGTPTVWEAAAAPANFAAVVGANGPRAFEFTFESAVRPGTLAPPPSPDGAPVAVLARRRAPAATTTTPSPAPARWLPASPVPGVGGLYGRAYLVGQGHLHFETTPRMEDWLGRLQALSLERQEEEETVSAVAQGGNIVGEGTALDMGESARVGDKRSAPPPSEDDDSAPGLAPPAPKRSRVGAVLQRTLSRLGGGRGGRNRAATTITTTTTTARPATPPLPVPAFCLAPPGSAFPSAALHQNHHRLTEGNVAAAAASGSGPLGPAPFVRAFSPFALLSSRAGSVAASSASQTVSRTVKVCLVGDVGAGKTAFFNRLVDDEFVSTSTSLVPDFKSVCVRADDGSAVNVELWDFPGIVAGARPGQLLSTFFHAAVICFSLEDKDNLTNVVEVWKPKLDASLHDQHVFVLGLKRDLRPAFPTLGLSFLPTKERATAEMGQQVAAAINASGYGECSARANDNVQGAWDGIISHIIASLDERERAFKNSRKRERPRTAVAGFLDRCGVGRLGRDRERM
ncbi:P-loop containing nucleoside triphosphate hydrolase protein [Parachaetomium inaequale]|uniref:P-loop containing nucleoside triphosphate hydrolase protein n=1 Tax=Parachaetomium inaequale TaxID=2588326 RepID=A0AAN6PGJ1_9PEZI|nr:P-loop containing nucleoside triphosphate hydrolase protein [Parachaetomium inaequale]